MSKFTIIGDPHVTHKSLDKANQLFDIVEKLGHPTIWLGDFLDTKEVIRGKCLNLIYNRLKQSKLEHIIIIGNHDLFNLESPEHALEALKSLHNVLIVDKAASLDGITFIPYIHDKSKIKEILEQSKDPIVFGHFDMSGFDYGNGYFCEDGLSLDDFSKFKRVISGHFHKFQSNKNFMYLGTPFSHSFGETNQDKFIAILESETLQVELIRTVFPRHITITIDCGDEDYCVQNQVGDGPKEGDFLRVIYQGKQENINRFKKNDIWPPGTKVMEKPTQEFNNNTIIDETSDNLSKFKSWASVIKNLDEDTIKLGLSILEGLDDN